MVPWLAQVNRGQHITRTLGCKTEEMLTFTLPQTGIKPGLCSVPFFSNTAAGQMSRPIFAAATTRLVYVSAVRGGAPRAREIDS